MQYFLIAIIVNVAVLVKHENKVTSDCWSRLWIGSRIQPSRIISQTPFSRQMAAISPTLFSSQGPIASSFTAPSPKVSLLVQTNSVQRIMKNVWCSKDTNSKNAWQKTVWEHHLRSLDKVSVICWFNPEVSSWQVNCRVSTSQLEIENVWRISLPWPQHTKHINTFYQTRVVSKTSSSIKTAWSQNLDKVLIFRMISLQKLILVINL